MLGAAILSLALAGQYPGVHRVDGRQAYQSHMQSNASMLREQQSQALGMSPWGGGSRQAFSPGLTAGGGLKPQQWSSGSAGYWTRDLNGVPVFVWTPRPW